MVSQSTPEVVTDDREHQVLFEAATGESLSSMKRAVRLAYSFEHELLRRGRSPGELDMRYLNDLLRLGGSAGSEAIRILQSRGVIRGKPGPHGGLVTLAPSSDYVRELVLQYVAHARMATADIAEARQAVSFLQTALHASHPGMAVFKFMNDILDGLLEWPAADVKPVRQRAARIARELAASVLRARPDPDIRDNLRLGHEDELCERFNVSRPVMRQAIRILEAQALVETRRGRGCGLFLASPQPGPVARLIGLWMRDSNLSLSDVLDIERPLRIAVAVTASKSIRCGPDHAVFALQQRSEAEGGIKLLQLIDMEKTISWLAGNPLLDLFLRTMTIYKISAGQYRQGDAHGLESYLTINRSLLQSLLTRNENRIERACEQKNECLREYDLSFGATASAVAN
ncbi:MAG TPA: GntR family transcriptional regulator [Steroidobacteraceae bacterium]